ncbi:MAG: hypothetical protein VXU42_00280 [Verrucomicrobiota bacterium]|nr:hypothetical protein [Verrucomicrobiota bacterium]
MRCLGRLADLPGAFVRRPVGHGDLIRSYRLQLAAEILWFHDRDEMWTLRHLYGNPMA